MLQSVPFGVALLSLVLSAVGASAQSGAATPSFDEFEVATIKPTPPNPAGRWIRMLSANEFAAKKPRTEDSDCCSIQFESASYSRRTRMG